MADRIVRTVEIFWDDQNTSAEGWAYRINFADGHEEGGPADGESDDGIGTLSSAVAGYLPEGCDAAALRWREMQGAKGWTARVSPDESPVEAPRPLDYEAVVELREDNAGGLWLVHDGTAYDVTSVQGARTFSEDASALAANETETWNVERHPAREVRAAPVVAIWIDGEVEIVGRLGRAAQRYINAPAGE